MGILLCPAFQAVPVRVVREFFTGARAEEIQDRASWSGQAGKCGP
jgi:hypothetical protein